MTTNSEPDAVPLAGLTAWAMPFDRAAGARVPTVPDNPGIIHAVRPRMTEMGLREPSFIEDTYMYRAALCGAKVKVIMPNTFRTQATGLTETLLKSPELPLRGLHCFEHKVPVHITRTPIAIFRLEREASAPMFLAHMIYFSSCSNFGGGQLAADYVP